jgi:PAS domain S-box-containing protein
LLTATLRPDMVGRVAPLLVICVCVGAISLIIDANTPLGLNMPALNVLLVVTAIWMPWPLAALALALVATLLTIMGHFLSPEPTEWVTADADTRNRLIAVTVSWISAALIMLQKTTQRRLIDMQARFRETFEQTAVGIAHVRGDGSLLMSNRCFHEILGYSDATELASKRLQDLMHPDDLRAYRNYIEEIMRGKSRTRSIELRLFRLDGSIVWIDQTVSRVFDRSDGKDGHFLHVIQNISERKQTEQYLAKLRAALESANDAIVIFNAGGEGAEPIIEYVNQAFSRMFRYDSGEVIGKAPDMLRSYESECSLVEELRGNLRTHDSYRREMVNYRSTGSEFVAEWHVTRIRDDADRTNHWVAVIRDMTEKHSYERALKESEQLARKGLTELETLYDTAPIGLAMFSRDLRFVRVNDRLAKINGVPAKQHVDRTPRQIVPGLADQVEPLLRKVLETGEPVLSVEIEGETPKAPGVLRAWREHYYPVFFEHSIEGVGAVVEEITEQKRAERHLQLVMHELNHRVKNSLAVVQSIASQTVRSSTSLADFEEALIGRIRALANAHTLLTESNWRFAKLSEIVREAIRPYRRGTNDTVQISGPQLLLTPSASLAFSMVLHELTTNAWKYGALSGSGGTLVIDWRLAEERGESTLLLQWTEKGGPQVVPPARPGFGGQLIDFTISHEFGGTSSVEYSDDGVVCDIAIPWEKVALDVQTRDVAER